MTSIISGIGSTLRPAAKQVIKGGLVATNAISQFATDSGGQFKGLVAEARMELKQTSAVEAAKPPVQSEGLWTRITDAGHAAWDSTTSAAAGILEKANEEVASLIAWFRGESKEEAQKQLKKEEEHIRQEGGTVVHIARDVAKDLAKDECVNVIETMILLAA